MIKKVQLKFFKQFKDQSFELKDAIVLAGPNNTGKTTLLQAIATWHFALREWQKKRGKSTAKKRTAVQLTRKEFLSVPVQRFNLLWTDASTSLRKDEGGGRGAATPRIMEITMEGQDSGGNEWTHGMEFRYASSESVRAKPVDTNTIPTEAIQVIYVPSFSGIETEEKVHTPEYQDWLVGQGKPGDIIRNLLAETSRIDSEWNKLQQDVEAMSGYRLLKPRYEGRPFILCEYLPGIPPKKGYGGLPKLDIASAGSGFLQTLLLLSFIYARPATIFLIDEPDAHLHVILQKKIYDHLRKVAQERQCQIVIATHSEVIIDNTPPEKIISFYDKPHLLIHGAERAQVREALKLLSPMDALQASGKKVLYVEDNSDFSILRAWARILRHPLAKWFSNPESNPFYYPIKGNSPKIAKNHFFALQAIVPNMLGVLLLDGDNRDIDNHDISADGLKIIQWKRYEIENYLIHPVLIKRFLEQKKAGPLSMSAAEKEMENILPPVVMQSPLGDHEYLQSTKASESILPNIFSAAGMDTSKQEYYMLAEIMEQSEIHHEVKERLDEIHAHWGK